jgi:hypothetical protein
VTWCLFALLAALAVFELKAPDPLPATAPESEFSAERAVIHVRAISRIPHPIGSGAERYSRDYILAQLSSLGMNPQVISAIGLHADRNVVLAGDTSNIVGRLPGTASSKALMLMAHYDSVPTAPGAADDAAGVAAILEAVRALRAGPVLRNDLIVLITDGEEAGLLGAEAFAASHPWMKDIGLIVNFEARGNQGPSLLFETSTNNASLIKGVAAGVPYANGSSLFYSLYKLLPNDTDVTVFRATNIPALNFAFGSHLEAYHSMLDSPDNLSLSSLQHHGYYALGVARQFGSMDLNELKKQQGDDIFFNWFGHGLLAYSQGMVLIGQIIITVILAAIVVISLRRGTQPARLLWALPASLAILLTVPLAMAAAGWLLFNGLKRDLMFGDTRANAMLLVGLVLLGAAAGSAIFAAARKRFGLQELSVAGLLLAGVLSWINALLLPAGSYLLAWPLFLSGAGLFLTVVPRRLDPWRAWASMVPGILAAILLFAPIAYLLYVFLTLSLASVAAVGLLVGVGFIVCIPGMDKAVPQGGWKGITALLMIGAGLCFATGIVESHPSKIHPRPDSLVYAYNSDGGKAVWASYDGSLDGWTSQFIKPALATREPLPDYLAGSRRMVISAPAALLPLQPPVADIAAHEETGDLHTLRMSVKSQRDADRMVVRFDGSIKPISLKISGREVNIDNSSSSLILLLYGTNSRSVELDLKVKYSGGLSFWLEDGSPGLPDNRSRAEELMAKQGSDETLVCRKYVLAKRSN